MYEAIKAIPNLSIDLPVDDPQLLALLSLPVEMPQTPIFLGAIVMVGITLAVVFSASGYRHATVVAGATSWMMLMLINFGLVPVVYEYQQQPLANIGHKIADTYNSSTDEVYYFQLHRPSVRFISGVPFTPIDRASQFLDMPYQPERMMIVTEEEKLKQLEQAFTQRYVTDCEGGYCLVTVQGQKRGNNQW